MGQFFTQNKQWIEFQFGGQRVGRFMEQVSGGQVEYSVADASPANSGGHVFRATRFRIAPLNISGYLTKDQYGQLAAVFDTYHKNRGLASDFSVRRVYKDGANQEIVEVYENLTVVTPPQPDDADTTQDTTFLNFSIQLQPEKKTVYIDGEKKMVFDPGDALDDAYVNP